LVGRVCRQGRKDCFGNAPQLAQIIIVSRGVPKSLDRSGDCVFCNLIDWIEGWM
jgi:hypothetical protein